MNANIFTFIKNRLPIIDVVGEYTTLKKAGSYWKGCCPFHQEKTASFTVSPHKEIFYCFGCHVSGDVISFIEKIEHCSAREAVQFLAQRYKIDLPAGDTEVVPIAQRDHYYEICKIGAQWFHEQINNTSHVREYIARRGISPEYITHFGIGYFPGGIQAMKRFLQIMRHKNILPHDLMQAGIVAEGKSVIYSPFEERIIFPIKDHLGRYCGFGGRIFALHDNRPKYYNSKENDYFSKGSLLYGLDLAKKHIQDSNTVIVVEGYTDCIALVQAGFPHTVATLGTACTPAHLKQLSRYAGRMYVLYDGDEAGRQAALRLATICWQANIEPYIGLLPKGLDPAGYCMQGGNIGAILSQAKDIFLYFIESLSTDFGRKNLQEKVSLIRRLLEVILEIDDPLKRDILLHKAAQHLDVSLELLSRELMRITTSHKEQTPVLSDNPNPEEFVGGALEKKLFSAIIHNIALVTPEVEKLLVEHMPPIYAAIIEYIVGMYRNSPQLSYSELTSALPKEVQAIVLKATLLEEDAATFYVLFEQFQKKHWKTVMRDIQKKLANAQLLNNHQEVQQLMEKVVLLQKALLRPSSLQEA